MVGGGCFGLRIGHSPRATLEMLTNELRLKRPLPRKSYALPSRGGGVPVKV